MLDYQVNGRLPQRVGNGHGVYAPHGVYRCAGEAEWVAISVLTEEQWREFCACAGGAAWLVDSRFTRLVDRHRNHEDLDALIEAWTESRQADEVMRTLQAVGVPASPVVAATDLLDHPQLKARGYFEYATRPEMGFHAHGLRWAQFRATPVQLRRAAPTLGEHNEEVLRGELGLTEAEVAALVADAVIGQEPVGGSRI